jgi:hypothetical protein
LFYHGILRAMGIEVTQPGDEQILSPDALAFVELSILRLPLSATAASRSPDPSTGRW